MNYAFLPDGLLIKVVAWDTRNWSSVLRCSMGFFCDFSVEFFFALMYHVLQIIIHPQTMRAKNRMLNDLMTWYMYIQYWYLSQNNQKISRQNVPFHRFLCLDPSHFQTSQWFCFLRPTQGTGQSIWKSPCFPQWNLWMVVLCLLLQCDLLSAWMNVPLWCF